jgi:succinate dehydrogenase / fumarate reductase cytochrome b subunit
LPITAISSITHRVSGIVNFFIAIPTFILLFLTDYLLANDLNWSSEKFNFEAKLLVSVSILSITYHIFSGLRHLLADFSNYGHELSEAKSSASVAFILTLLVSFFLILEVW